MTTIRHLLGIASLLAAGLVQAAPTVSLTSPTANTVLAASVSLQPLVAGDQSSPRSVQPLPVRMIEEGLQYATD